jgi:hypothetical protein
MNGIEEEEHEDMARASEIYYKYVSPFSLAAIVMLNFLLIYLNLVNLENQGTILKEIQENTEIGLTNQELGLNISNANQDMLEHILRIQANANQTVEDLNEHIKQTNETLFRLTSNESNAP